MAHQQPGHDPHKLGSFGHTHVLDCALDVLLVVQLALLVQHLLHTYGGEIVRCVCVGESENAYQVSAVIF